MAENTRVAKRDKLEVLDLPVDLVNTYSAVLDRNSIFSWNWYGDSWVSRGALRGSVMKAARFCGMVRRLFLFNFIFLGGSTCVPSARLRVYSPVDLT